MGTRNLTMVILDQKPVVAQYGQWDGYPTGQGNTVLSFLHRADFDVQQFREQLAKCRFSTEADVDGLNDILRNPPEWSKTEHRRGVCYLSRDAAAEVLGFLYDTERDEIVLVDETEFADDGLMCEWAYVLDLDSETLEVYQGFQTTAPLEQQRFCGPDTAPPADWKPRWEGQQWYFPVQLVEAIPFASLPKHFTEQFGYAGDQENPA